MMKNISIIVAVDENFGIGKDNKLLCHIPNDLKRFKRITLHHKIIMGRKTFESLPNQRPLPKRINIVLSKNKDLRLEGCAMAYSVAEALKLCQSDESFVIGGEAMYRAFLPYANKLYLTKIYHSFQADTFFPKIISKKWRIILMENQPQDDKHLYAYTFLELVKKSDGACE